MASKYGWVITKDHIADKEAKAPSNCNAVGMIGPRDCEFPKDQMVLMGQAFQMYDDDKNLYYEGFLLNGQGFEPVEDFGLPNAGAVHIKINGESI